MIDRPRYLTARTRDVRPAIFPAGVNPRDPYCVYHVDASGQRIVNQTYFWQGAAEGAAKALNEDNAK